MPRPGSFARVTRGTPLIDAARRGCAADAAALLADGADVNERAADGTCITALHVACYNGHTKVVTTLLAANAVEVNQADKNGATPLVVACVNGHAEIATKLIAANANVNQAKNEGVTPLYLACQNGHTEVVATLLAADANVDQAEDAGVTPLIIALDRGHIEVATKLLAANAAMDHADSRGVTPLWIASQEGHTEVVKTLIAANIAVNQATANGATPLLVACEKGHNEVATTLIVANAKVDQADHNGETALYVACSQGHTEVVAMLLAAKATVNQHKRNGWTPLCVACSKGHAEVVAKLVAADANVDQATYESATPLHLACQAGYDQDEPDPELAVRLTDIVATLLGAKASVDQGDERGQTALYIACHLSHRGIVKLLSSYGARRTFPFAGPPYDTAENIAASKGHRKLAADLVRSRHWTALHHVTILTYKRAFDLLRGGANILATARVDGPTPLSLAQAAAAGSAAKGTIGEGAFLILEAAKPWSRQTHKLFPAPARARAVELMLVGELLSREERFAAYGPQAVVDAWMTFVVPQAVSRNRVQVVGIKGRPELNGQDGTIGEFYGAKGRFPVSLEGGESVLIKMMNLVAIGD